MALADALIRRRGIVAASAAGAGVLGAPTAALAGVLTPESGGSPNADHIHTLYVIVLVLALVILFGVWIALAYAMVKFKARKGVVATQTHGNTRLEVGWTIAAAVVVVALAVVAFIELPKIQDIPGGAEATARAAAAGSLPVIDSPAPRRHRLNVLVNGQQYVWRYWYDLNGNHEPDASEPYSYEAMAVPVGATVTLDITSQDVIHSWWIPKLGGKFDAVPGYTNHTWFQISKPGVYRGQCAELCGRNHANMLAEVDALAPSAFEHWIARQRRDLARADQAAASARRRLESGGQP